MRYRRDPAELEPCFRRDVSDEQLLCATGKKALIGILVCLLSFVILIGLIIFILPSSKEVDGGDIDYVHRDIVPPYLSFTSEGSSSSAEQFAVEEDEPQNDCSLHKKISGVYNIAPNDAKPLPVYCQQETNGGGWTVIQRRIDGAVHFYNRTWLEYEQGFGVPGSSQWIGLENIYHLIASVKADWILRIELYGDYCTGAGCLKQENGYWWAEWPFKIGDASSLYALEIGTVIAGNLTGPDQPDLFQQNNGCPFSTIDNDNDHIDNVNCAQFRNYGGWWHNACGSVSLNGMYYRDTYPRHRYLSYLYENPKQNLFAVTSYLQKCLEQKLFNRIVMTELHNANDAEGNAEEEEKSEDTGDRKDEKHMA
ncbi:hypothetical protein Q1695_001068 [Nippostrongylus brasiliensis]|nr:hypothetical protein Q1695_001068 [Nippostrongylus brasiliensis]